MLGNVVGEVEDVFLEGIVLLYGYFDCDVIFLFMVEVEDLVDWGFVGVQVFNKSM